ncbi:MAG: response regulator [Chloroflexaceae bacterium]|nr:response regulator [Chloroflexaceae bacterium]NJO06411.1 response regulator [Chloroflexaceae bacterium]
MAQKILVVDDEAPIRQLLTYQLGGAGYEVQAVDNGRTALERLLIEQPDLVLLDVVMPGMSGWEVCRQIRQYSSVPVIMLTAKSADGDVVTGLNIGADDYIPKPYSLAQLLARVDAVLRRASVRAVPRVSAEPLLETARAVYRNGSDRGMLAPDAYSTTGDTAAPGVVVATAASTPVPTALGTADTRPEPLPLPYPLTYASLGKHLAVTRRKQGYSLYQVERATGIRWEFLQGLERGEFEAIPRPELRRVLYRYCSFLNIDLRELARTTAQPVTRRHSVYLSWIVPVLTVVVLALVFVLAWSVF